MSAAGATNAQPSGEYFDITEASGRLEAVGESHYQETLAQAVGGWPREYVTHEVVATLVAEPDNPYDKNAVAVRVGQGTVGYLSRGDAVAYQGLFDHLRGTGYLGVSCRAVICGGGEDRPNLGIFLRAADPHSARNRAGAGEAPLPPVAQLVAPEPKQPRTAAPTSARRGEPRTLWCERGQHHWERSATRGRPPRNCPEHR